MSYICDYICTSKIFTFVRNDIKGLKTLSSVTYGFDDIINNNYFSLWNQLFKKI